MSTLMLLDFCTCSLQMAMVGFQFIAVIMKVLCAFVTMLLFLGRIRCSPIVYSRICCCNGGSNVALLLARK